MFTATQRTSGGATNISQILASETRLNRLHRLFKSHVNVTEPSLVLEPYLFLGNCISAHDIHRLSRLGIRYVLNVAIRDVEVCPYYSSDMRTLTIDLRDDDRENIIRAFDQAFAFIDEARRVKSRVLVHCSHGQSRSPTIVIGYLMHTYNISLEQCLAHVIKARPCIIPNDGFLKQLILFDRFLVDRRQKQQEAAIRRSMNNTLPTEIPIQHHSTGVSQPVNSSAPVILNPPQHSSISTNNSSNISSVDSSSIGLTSTSTSVSASASSAESSISTNSIQVIPIQISSKEPSPEKSESISIKPTLADDEIVIVEEANKSVQQLEEQLAATSLSNPNSSKVSFESSSSHSALASKKRSRTKKSKDVKKHSSHISRSNTGNLERSQVNNYQYESPYVLTPQQWNVINSYPTNYYGHQEHVKIKYITEIYDRATNRFIPTTCCY